MKIPFEMPDFSENTALVAAGGDLEARIFRVKDNFMTLQAALSLSPPEQALRNKAAFSEHELSYSLLQKTLAHYPHRKALRAFANQLAGALSEMARREKASAVYLLLSANLAAEMKARIGPRIGELIKAVYVGEYSSLEPLGILAIIRHGESQTLIAENGARKEEW